MTEWRREHTETRPPPFGCMAESKQGKIQKNLAPQPVLVLESHMQVSGGRVH